MEIPQLLVKEDEKEDMFVGRERKEKSAGLREGALGVENKSWPI